MQTQKEQFNSERRRLLQFTAGTVAQTVLPPLPLSVGSVAKAAGPTVVTAVTENYAALMVRSLSKATWAMSVNRASLSLTYPSYTPDTYKPELMLYGLGRLSDLFSFYALHNEQQILSAQKTESWEYLVDQVQLEMTLRAKTGEKAQGISYTHASLHSSKGFVTQKQILCELMNLIDETLSRAEDPGYAYGMPVHDEIEGGDQGVVRWSELDRAVIEIGNRYFQGFKPSMATGLSMRQKIEFLLEFSHDAYCMDPIPRHAGSRRQWFDIPASFPSLKLMEGEALERGMPNNVLDLYREKVAPFSTLPEQLQSLYEGHFSIEEYFQRRDALVSELDLLFARRDMKKRLEMKRSSRQESVVTRDRDASPSAPASLLRSVAAIRSIFSRASDKLSGFLRTAFVENIISAGHEKTEPLMLENKPADYLDLEVLSGEEVLVPLRQISPQP